MSTTVIEALENAKVNFETAQNMGRAGSPIFMLAMEQLLNAIEALENDLKPNDVIQESMGAEVVTTKRG